MPKEMSDEPQNWNAETYVKHAAFVPDLGAPVVALLAPQAGENILDLGCGDGAITADIAKICTVHGVDASSSMIEKARGRGLQASVVNGQQLSFSGEFDAVFSNAALHWMTDYSAVLQGVHRALKPGGRFVGEFGGAGNIQHLVNAIQQVFDAHPDFGAITFPWFFPTPAFYQHALEAHGFDCHYIERIPRPTPLASGVRQWLELFAAFALEKLHDAQKKVFLDHCESILQQTVYSAEKGWVADYVRLRFAARKLPELIHQ